VLLRPRPVRTPAPRGRTGVFARLAVESVLDRVLRGRGWICFVALALGGIVFMQVWLLKLNTGISRAVQTSATLEMQNSSLQARIARLSSQERIEREVTALGMQIPEAGDLEHVRVRGSRDGVRAAQRMSEPSDEARQVLAAAGALSAQPAAGSLPGAPAPAASGESPAAIVPASAPTTTDPATAVGMAPTTAVPTTPAAATGVAVSPQG
jgi:cell division protein FtsL